MMEASTAWTWLGALSALCAVLSGLGNLSSAESKSAESPRGGKKASKKEEETQSGSKLDGVHYQWLGLHFITKLADWLQGTNMYTLYQSYGVDPGVLFLTGFLTSAIFSVILGHWVDTFGRKRFCIIYCVLEIIIQVLEHFKDIRILLVGRVLGGASTALLFSSFESWLVSAHHQRKLSEGSLVRCFSLASTLNGISAVLAGLIARVAFNWGGEIAPFQVSLVLTCIALVWVIVFWDENYGDTNSKVKNDKPSESWISLVSQPKILIVAFTQAMFEGAMYTFVFMWVQTFLTLAPGDARPPIEVLFSCLMVALTIGGVIFEYFSESIRERRPERIGAWVFMAAATAMGTASLALTNRDQAFIGEPFGLSRVTTIMIAFCLFEICVGMFDPWSSTMRSMYVPEEVMATVMTLTRVPLNLLVGLGVHLTENYDLTVVFGVCTGMHLACAATCWLALKVAQQTSRKEKAA